VRLKTTMLLVFSATLRVLLLRLRATEPAQGEDQASTAPDLEPPTKEELRWRATPIKLDAWKQWCVSGRGAEFRKRGGGTFEQNSITCCGKPGSFQILCCKRRRAALDARGLLCLPGLTLEIL
jgi:hypothetical protein